MTNNEMLVLYRNMVIERHEIWRARQAGWPQPWTEDPILQNLKMTNMFRVLDPGSQFVFDLDANDDRTTIGRLVFYRMTNLPATWEALKEEFGGYPSSADFLYNQEMLYDFLNRRRRAGHRIFSGAYIIIPEPGTANDKIEGALRVTARFLEDNAFAFFNASTQEERYKALRATPGIGRFLAMQILADWTYLQPDEPDHSFIVAGPGARRGAALIEPNMQAEDVIHDLAIYWSDHTTIRLDGRGLTVMDVQNTLCEFSKYAREVEYPRKKSPYRPAHPGPQPTPVLPRWW